MAENETKTLFDPKVESLYQQCLLFQKDFGEITSSEGRKRFSSIYVQYYLCLKDDPNLPDARLFLDLNEEFLESLEAVQFVHAIAQYYYDKQDTEVMPYG